MTEPHLIPVLKEVLKIIGFAWIGAGLILFGGEVYHDRLLARKCKCHRCPTEH